MNWNKIKSIMIYCLIAMNLFMAAFIVWTNYRDTHIPDKVIEASLDILRRDGFECDKKLVPTASYELPVLNTSFYSPDELSEIFFGKQMPFKTDNESLVATDGISTLTVTDTYFSYKSSAKPSCSYSKRGLKKALSKVGLNMDGAVYDEKEHCFYRMYKGVNLFNMYIRAELDSDGNLCNISAQWPTRLIPGDSSKLSFVTSVTKVKDAFPDGGKISLIEKGYTLTSPGNNNYCFIPSWRVKAGNELKIIE